MTSETKQDLIALVADADMERAVRTILKKRTGALNIRLIRFEVFRHPQRDPGIVRFCSDFLRPYLTDYDHALVLLDHQGSGRENEEPEDLAQRLEMDLDRSGWGNRAAVVVISPELEAWIWSPSPHVARVLGISSPEELNEIIRPHRRSEGLKPENPKEAFESVLRRSGRPASPHIFEELAERVSLQSCTDGSFEKLRRTLNRWFPL